MLSLNPELQQKLKADHLIYVTNKAPGLFRQRVGKKLVYYHQDGKRITDKELLTRINDLKIPPAWKSVWVSPLENSHLQATGKDQKGRTQYIYHPSWIKICKENKFSRVADFGLSLSKIREKVRHDLKLGKLEKRKILATIVWLLENTFIRIGNEEYSKENRSFGLTTLRNRHVKITEDRMFFEFTGKSGVRHRLQISQPTVIKTIKRCIELPGYELFQYFDPNGNRHVIDSQDVNSFLKDTTKQDFSAKDFRTWGATDISANHLYKLGSPGDLDFAKKAIGETVKKVAKHLNNTISVCRNYYIHPTVINTYQQKILNPHFNQFAKSRLSKKGLSWDEVALIRLLQKYPY